MDEGKTNIEYTGTDILNYFAGKLNAAEMHAMEKAALDDPFLAEAMEGYSTMPAEEVKSRLAVLHTNFSPQDSAKIVALETSKKFSSWKVAAAILVICTGIALTYLFTARTPVQNDSLAKVSPPKSASEPVAQAVPDSTSTLRLSDTDLEKAKPPVELFAGKNDVGGDSTFIYRPAKPAPVKQDDLSGGGYIERAEAKSEETALNNNSTPYAQQNAARNAAPVNKAASEPATIASGENQISPVLVINGQVLAPDSTPLPFANVRITDDNVSTYADANGNFKLVSRDSVLKMQVSAEGYISRNLHVRADQMPETIILARGDIEAAKKSVTRARTSPVPGFIHIVQPDTTGDVRPLVGWRNYEAYIANNLQNTPNEGEQSIKGEIQISFDVGATGTLSNFKVDKSLCNTCDEEVLRLVKEGPKWTLSGKKNGRGTIRIRF